MRTRRITGGIVKLLFLPAREIARCWLVGLGQTIGQAAARTYGRRGGARWIAPLALARAQHVRQLCAPFRNSLAPLGSLPARAGQLLRARGEKNAARV